MSAQLFPQPKASILTVVTVATELVVCSFRGVANIVGVGSGQLTWPSRVPLRTSCSAILNSSSKWDQQRGGLGV